MELRFKQIALFVLFPCVLIFLFALLYYPPFSQASFKPMDEKPFVEGAKEDKIFINTATMEELMLLPGIGESRAKEIVAFREENGGIDSIEELRKVKGIGPAIAAELEEFVRFS